MSFSISFWILGYPKWIPMVLRSCLIPACWNASWYQWRRWVQTNLGTQIFPEKVVSLVPSTVIWQSWSFCWRFDFTCWNSSSVSCSFLMCHKSRGNSSFKVQLLDSSKNKLLNAFKVMDSSKGNPNSLSVPVLTSPAKYSSFAPYSWSIAILCPSTLWLVCLVSSWHWFLWSVLTIISQPKIMLWLCLSASLTANNFLSVTV